MSSFFRKLKIRALAAWRILKGFDEHWFLVKIEKKQLENLFLGKDFEINILYHGLRDYPIMTIVKKMSETKDDVDMMLMKAEFEANSEEFNSKKENNK
jgi:hypothetical protein